MREIIEMGDGYPMAIEFNSLDGYNDEESYYNWLNEIAYTGEGVFDPITMDEFADIERGVLRVVLED